MALPGRALWPAADLVTTGDALWSSHQTHRRVRDSGDVTGLRAVGRIPRHVASILWVPALAGSIAGLAAAWARDRERVAVPVAALAVAAATSGALAIAGQTVLLRFFLFPAAVLAVLAAYAALGWVGLEPGDRARGAWRLGGVALLVGFAAFAPKDASRAGDLRDRFRGDEQLQSRLVGLATGPARTAPRACRPGHVQLCRVVPTPASVDGRDPDRPGGDLASSRRDP